MTTIPTERMRLQGKANLLYVHSRQPNSQGKKKKNSNIETKYKYCPLKITQKNLGNLEICSGKVT